MITMANVIRKMIPDKNIELLKDATGANVVKHTPRIANIQTKINPKYTYALMQR